MDLAEMDGTDILEKHTVIHLYLEAGVPSIFVRHLLKDRGR